MHISLHICLYINPSNCFSLLWKSSIHFVKLYKYIYRRLSNHEIKILERGYTSNNKIVNTGTVWENILETENLFLKGILKIKEDLEV